jgi:ABC-type polysaccharide/polyol phosphate export permease
MFNKLRLDLIDSIKAWALWYFYAVQDIRNRYSRSVIGPLWITISLAITIFAMGPLYSVIFHFGGNGYLTHLASGLVFWSYIAGTLSESCTAFIGNESFIKQTKYPLFVYIARLVTRNLIVLGHNIGLVILIAIFENTLSYKAFFIIPNLILISIFLFFSSYLFALICARYRDLVPLVSNVLQLFMFLTPVFWVASGDTLRSKYLLLNPFNYLINLLRGPVTGNLNYVDWLVVSLVTIAVMLLVIFLNYRFSKKVVYWI